MSAKKQKTCCVPDCKDKNSLRHSIPADKRIRELWLDRIKNNKLQNIRDKRSLSKYAVCDIHFSDNCKDVQGKLRKYSLPTINLPEFNEPPTIDNSFSFPPQEGRYVTPEKVKRMLMQFDASQPSTSTSPDSPHVFLEKTRKTYQSKKPKVLFTHEDVIKLDETKELEAGLEQLIDEPSVIPVTEISSDLSAHFKHAKTVEIAAKKKRTTIPDVSRVFRKSLTPKERRFYKEAIRFRKLALRFRNKKELLKKQLIEKKYSGLSVMKTVNDESFKFFVSQLRTQKYKPKGRRFTIDDKVFALSLFKQSGKSYRYLSKIFSLPSRKTLTTFLNRIPFIPGINQYIFEQLKNSVSKMNPLSKYCVILFDEISLDCGLQYNSKFDVIEGFVDFGGPYRMISFADHALVFMVKGIYKKWKQPVCFTFCEGTTSVADLKRTLKEVVQQTLGKL